MNQRRRKETILQADSMDTVHLGAACMRVIDESKEEERDYLTG
jgi:hypothetical protein